MFQPLFLVLRALVSHTFVFVYMREFGYYILFGACGIKGNHYETTKDNFKNILSGTQPTVKHSDFASPCSINHLDVIENGGGRQGSFNISNLPVSLNLGMCY